LNIEETLFISANVYRKVGIKTPVSEIPLWVQFSDHFEWRRRL